MELRQLRQALMLADTLNFHRAAEQLSMTQPPLSISIKKLEDELGIPLFERLPTGLRLTQAGDAVLRNARSTLFFVEEMRRVARKSQSGERGQVRVGGGGTAAYTLLPGIIGSFRSIPTSIWCWRRGLAATCCNACKTTSWMWRWCAFRSCRPTPCK
ncbi:LysR family transcriptional regulator [Pseudomonas aeruginosa]|nr:LysR family transcriptional regulator [Pseudomonas aeruginosa]